MTVAAVSVGLATYVDGGRQKCSREHRCRMCLHERQRRGVRQLTRHHIVPRRWFVAHSLPTRLRDAEANIVPLCARCHREVEIDEWARRMLRKVLDQSEIAFAIQLRGKLWFDLAYPSPRMKEEHDEKMRLLQPAVAAYLAAVLAGEAA